MAFAYSFVVAAILTASAPSPSPYQQTYRVVFRMPLSVFITMSNSSQRDARLDWGTDGCSAPFVGNTGRTFDFTDACRRHDFAYRNFKALSHGKWWTSSMRHRIDRVFRSDMLRDCARRARVSRKICRTWAHTYYRSVRTYGGV